MRADNVLEIDRTALRHNLRVLRALAPEQVCYVTVKANAYGLGDVPVAKTLAPLVDGFCVATPEEAFRLRAAGIAGMILVLGYVPEEAVEAMVRQTIRPAVFTMETAEAFAREAVRQRRRHPIHLAVDTGHSRIGFVEGDPATLPQLRAIAQMDALCVEGIFSHFATADEADPGGTETQILRFRRLTDALRAEGLSLGVRHLANDAGVLCHRPQALFDGVRLGISVYGIYPSKVVAAQHPVDLRPVCTWRSVVCHVKTIAAGETVSYGRTWRAERPTRLATIQVGFADGVRRGLSNCGSILLHGVKCPIRGAVCMDQLMVEVGDLDVQPGEEAIVLGADVTGVCITPEEMADCCSTIPYEILTGISSRVDREYRG